MDSKEAREYRVQRGCCGNCDGTGYDMIGVVGFGNRVCHVCNGSGRSSGPVSDELDRLKAELAEIKRNNEYLEAKLNESHGIMSKTSLGLQAVEVMAERDALKAAADLMIKFLDDAAMDGTNYLVPNSPHNKDWYVNRCLWWFDGPREREIRAALDAAKEGRE